MKTVKYKIFMVFASLILVAQSEAFFWTVGCTEGIRQLDFFFVFISKDGSRNHQI